MDEISQHNVIRGKFVKFLHAAMASTVGATTIALIKNTSWKDVFTIPAQSSPSTVNNPIPITGPDMTLMNGLASLAFGFIYILMTVLIIDFTIRTMLDIVCIVAQIDEKLYRSDKVKKVIDTEEPLLNYLKDSAAGLSIMLLLTIALLSGGISTLLNATMQITQAGIN